MTVEQPAFCVAPPLSSQRARAHRLLTEFADTTSMHGVRRAAISHALNARICWSMLTIACVLGFLVQFCILVGQYKTYPVSVKRLSQAVEFHFPDLTFCVAGNFLERPELPMSKQLLNLEANLDEYRASNVSRIPDLFKLMSRIRYCSVTESDYYLPLEDIIVDCVVHGEPCNASMFSRHSSSKYRGCYTFHSHLGGEDVDAGQGPKFDLSAFGVRLVLYTHNDSLTGTSVSSTGRSDNEIIDLVEGIKTVIHPHTTYPVPEFRGVTMASAKAYQFSVRMLETRSIPTPAKPCQEGEQAGLVRVRDRTTGKLTEFSYDQQLCLMRAYQEFFFTRCACISYAYPVFEQYQLRDQCHYIQPDWLAYLTQAFYIDWNNTARDVVDRLVNRSLCHDDYFNNPEAASSDAIELCAHPCVVQSYPNVVSMAKWPTVSAYPLLVSRLNRIYDAANLSGRFTVLDQFANNQSLSMLELQQRVTKIDVLAESFLADLEEEELAYTIEKLLSDLGGNLGLWVGVSVLTVLEILDLLLSYIMLMLGRRYRRMVQDSALPPQSVEIFGVGSYRPRRTSLNPNFYLRMDSAGTENAASVVSNNEPAKQLPETQYI